LETRRLEQTARTTRAPNDWRRRRRPPPTSHFRSTALTAPPTPRCPRNATLRGGDPTAADLPRRSLTPRRRPRGPANAGPRPVTYHNAPDLHGAAGGPCAYARIGRRCCAPRETGDSRRNDTTMCHDSITGVWASDTTREARRAIPSQRRTPRRQPHGILARPRRASRQRDHGIRLRLRARHLRRNSGGVRARRSSEHLLRGSMPREHGLRFHYYGAQRAPELTATLHGQVARGSLRRHTSDPHRQPGKHQRAAKNSRAQSAR
jgi:hypothetical protein